VRNGPDHRGKLRVLVVGAGNSGCDLAVDTAQHRLDVDIVLRDGVHFQPKAFFGVPRQQVSFLSELSPSDQDLIARLLARVSLGPWCNYPASLSPAHPAPMETTFLHAVINGSLSDVGRTAEPLPSRAETPGAQS
jgi:cation diffusion facilitator CzcD-associated flavoprotein CzcO